jgi:hypothetical protein
MAPDTVTSVATATSVDVASIVVVAMSADGSPAALVGVTESPPSEAVSESPHAATDRTAAMATTSRVRARIMTILTY